MSDSAAALWESELLRAREWLAATRTDKQHEHVQLFQRVKAHISYKDHQRSLQSETLASEDEDDTALDFLADVDASDMSALLQAEAAKAAPSVEDMPPPVETTMPSAKDLMKPLDMPSNLASPMLKPKVNAVPMSQLDPKTLGSSSTSSVTAGATLGADEDVQKLMVSLNVALPAHSEETKTEESTPPHLLKNFGGGTKAGNHGLHVNASRKLEQLKYMQQASSKSPQDPHKKKAATPATTKQDDDVTQEMLSWVTGCRDPEVIKRKENLRRKRKHPHRYGMASEEEQRQVLMKARQIARDSDSESEDDFSSDYSPAEDGEMPELDEPEVVDLLSDDYLDSSDEDKRPARRKRKRLRQTNTTVKKKVRSRKPAVTRKLSQPDSSSESTPPPSNVEENQLRGSSASEASHTPAMTKSAPAEKLVDGITGKSHHPIELLSSDDESGRSDEAIPLKAVGDRGADTNAGTTGVTQEPTILRSKIPNSFKSPQDRVQHELKHNEKHVPVEPTNATPLTTGGCTVVPAVEEVSSGLPVMPTKSIGPGRVQESGILDSSRNLTDTTIQSSDADAGDADVSDTGTIDLEEEDLSLGTEDHENIAMIGDTGDLNCREEQGEPEHGTGEKRPRMMTGEVISSSTAAEESSLGVIESEETGQVQPSVQVNNGVKGSETTTGEMLSNTEVDDEDVSDAETELLDDDEPDTDDLGLDYSDDSDSGGNRACSGNSQTNGTAEVQKDGAVSSDKKTPEARNRNGEKENTLDSSNAGVQQFFDFKPLKLKPKANVTTTTPKPLPVHTYSETHTKTGGNDSEKVTGERQKSSATPAKPAGSNGLRPSKRPIATTTTFKGKYAVTRRSTKMLAPGDTPGAKRQAKSQYTMVPTTKVSSSKDLDDVPLAFLAKELQKKPDDNPQTKYLLYAGAKKTEDVPTYTADTSRVVPKSRFGGGSSSLNTISSAKQDYQAPSNGRQSLVNGKNAPQGGYRREPQISIYDALHMDGQESASDIRDGTGYKRPSRFKKMQEEAARNGTPMVKSRLQSTDWDKVPIPRKLPQVEKATRDAVLPSPPKKNGYGSKIVGNTPNKRRKKSSGSSNKNAGPSYYGPQATTSGTKDRYDSPSRGHRGREHNKYRREDDRWRKRSASPPSRDRDRSYRRDDRKRRGSPRSRSRSVSPQGRDYSSSRHHHGLHSRSWSRERPSEHDPRRTERPGPNYRDRDRDPQSNGGLGSPFSDYRDSTKKRSSEPGEVRQNGKPENADSSVKKQKRSDYMEASVSPGALATFNDDGDTIYISDSDDDEKNLIKEVEDVRFDLDDVAVDEALMAKQVYVTGLNPTLVAEQIEEDFARFGVAVDRETGFPAIDLFPSQRNHLCRGDACVTFETEDGAQEAAEELNAKNVKNSMIRVRRMDIHTQRILNVQFQTVRDTWKCTETRCRADVSIWTGKCNKCGRKRVYAPSNVKIGAESWLCSLERFIRHKLSRLQGIPA